MAFCATCGSPVEGQFCAKCGGRVAAAPSAASCPSMQASGAMADNVASALCYLLGLITGIIFLVLAPYNKNPVIRFHAFQSIFLHVACIVIMIGLNIVLGILHLWGMFFLGSLFWLAFFVLWTIMSKSIDFPACGLHCNHDRAQYRPGDFAPVGNVLPGQPVLVGLLRAVDLPADTGLPGQDDRAAGDRAAGAATGRQLKRELPPGASEVV